MTSNAQLTGISLQLLFFLTDFQKPEEILSYIMIHMYKHTYTENDYQISLQIINTDTMTMLEQRTLQTVNEIVFWEILFLIGHKNSRDYLQYSEFTEVQTHRHECLKHIHITVWNTKLITIFISNSNHTSVINLNFQN